MDLDLYLLEVFIEKITPDPAIIPELMAKEISVCAEVGPDIRMIIEYLNRPHIDNRNAKVLDYNCGKSHLFASSPDGLRATLATYPVALTLQLGGEARGVGAVPWKPDLDSTILAVAKETYRDKTTTTLSQDEQKVADVTHSLRLLFFGHHLQTTYQLLENVGQAPRKYIVRGTHGNSTYRFESSRDAYTDPGSGVVPILPIAGSIFVRSSETMSIAHPNNNPVEMSFMALFNPDFDFGQKPGGYAMQDANRNSNMTYDLVSLRGRPEENKFFDLKIKPSSHGYLFEFDPIAGGFDIPDGRVNQQQQASELTIVDELTADRINKLLCKNRDCPAAKKFKELGLGPLSKERCVGSAYLDAAPYCTYGLSQTYGVLNEYGPYGLFSRPKRPNQPFIPKEDKDSWNENCWKPKKHRSKTQTKSKGCCNTQPPSCYPTQPPSCCQSQAPSCVHSPTPSCCSPNAPSCCSPNAPSCCNPNAPSCCSPTPSFCSPTPSFCSSQPSNLEPSCCNPLRLTGGGVFDYENVKNQFDEVLEKNKQALEPCCTATCSVALNVTTVTCNNICNSLTEYEISLDSSSTSCLNVTSCCNSNAPSCCSPTPSFCSLQLLNLEPPCCNPLRLTGGGIFDYEKVKSPLHECQDIMNQFDEVLEKYKKALGPCGTATCPFAPNVTAETCKNICHSPAEYEISLNSSSTVCPHPELCPVLSGQTEKPHAACGSPRCAYAQYKTRLPDDDAIMELQFLPSVSDGRCGRPKCPFPIEPDLPPIHWDCPDPLPEGPCKNPNCPHLPRDLSCLTRIIEPTPLCGHADCPYAMPPPCDSPNCPFNPKACPYAEPPASSVDELCDNPDCPYNQPLDDGSLCDNPDCPYVQAEQANRPCYEAPPCPQSPCPAMACPNDAVTYITAIVQYLLNAFNICPGNLEGTCPYPSQADALNICLGGPTCPLVQKAMAKQEQQAQSTSDCCGVDSELDGEPVEITTGDRELGDTAPCNPETCGPDFPCDECCDELTGECRLSQSERLERSRSALQERAKSEPALAKKVRAKGKQKKKYVYSIGDKYPGVQIGHRECVTPGLNVPARMGWLWNVFTPCMQLRPRRGWKPGAIGRRLAKIIRRHREARGLKPLELKSLRRRRGFGGDSGSSINIKPKPTLQIKKKDGTYWITMNPLKDPKTLVENENPYMDCTPMQFKIVKNEKPKECCSEYRSCFCGEEEPQESSSDSELDIEFTPPAGLIHPERFKKKKNVVHCDTQYLASDFAVPKSKAGSKKGGKKGKKGKKGKGGKGGKKGGKGKGGKKKK